MTDRNIAIHRAFQPDDLVHVLDGADIEGAVLVQTRASLDETREFLAIAERTPAVKGVVGWVDLTAADVGEVLAQLRDDQGGRWLVGVRHQVHDEDDPEWLDRPDVTRGIRSGGEAGLAYDLLVRPRELPAAWRAAQRSPGVRFVVDHVAKPPIASGDTASWTSWLQSLAKLPNVFCKLSGLVTEADWGTWRSEDIQPYIQHAIELFGPDRCMFGSDWPVCLLAASYDQVVAALHDALVALGDTDRARIWGGTAADVYGLGSLPMDTR